MQPEIQAVLEARRFFKLICGASYRNRDFIRELAHIFTAAGAHVIDIGARTELIQAVQAGIQRAQAEDSVQAPLIMVSVGINEDIHFLKVDKNFDRCTDHGYCANACPHEVFVGAEIRLENCLGCDHCIRACPEQALTLIPRDPLEEIGPLLESCLAAGARALEVHTGTGNRTELQALLNTLKPLQEQFDLIAFSLGAHGQSHAELAALAHDIVAQMGPRIIIQADGEPISGRKGKKSTLPALDLASYLIETNLPSFIQVSGGVNNLTGSLAREAGIPIHGVGMGSFARKYLDLKPSDSLSHSLRQSAIHKARELVRSV